MRGLQVQYWTREKYDQLVERGILTPDNKVELIEGELVTLPPQNARHAVSERLAQEELRIAFGSGFDVRPALPLIAGDDSEPEPDLAVVPGRPRDYVDSHPSTAVLVVEIADSSLTYDRTRKARLYARQGIPEYWIENLRDDVIEVYREPQINSESPADATYTVRMILRRGDVVSPLAVPDAIIAVSDLLP